MEIRKTVVDNPGELRAHAAVLSRAGRPHAAWSGDIRLPPGVIAAAIVAMAAALRLIELGWHSVWLDEAFVVAVTRESWDGLLATLRTADSHPPLYYLIVKAWTAAAGTGEVALRLPSACASVMTVVLTYALARRLVNESTALLSAFLVAISPFDIMAGQEARMYAVLGTLTVGSTLALVIAVGDGGWRRWTLYGVLAALASYTHYLGLLVILGHGLWIAGWKRAHAGAWIRTIAVVSAAFAPQIPVLWRQAFHAPGFAWYRPGDVPMALADLLGLLAFGGSLFGAAGYLTWYTGALGPSETFLLLLPFLALLLFGVLALRERADALFLIALPALVPPAALFCVSMVHPMFVPRWFSFIMPFYAIVAAAGVFGVVDRFRGRRDQAAALLVTALFLYNAPTLFQYYFVPGARPFQWRDAATIVSEHVRPGDLLLYVSPADLPFRYYFHASDPSIVLPSPGSLTAARVRNLARQYPRIWLVATLPMVGSAQDRLFSALTVGYGLAWQADFGGAHLFLMEHRPAAGGRT